MTNEITNFTFSFGKVFSCWERLSPLSPGGIHLLMADLHSALVLRLRSEVPMN